MEERIILFFDFLGFKNIVETKTEEEIINLYQIITNIYDLNQTHFGGLESETITQFSDSVVISYDHKLNPESILEIIENIQRTHIELIKYGVLIRGAVTIGELYHKNFKLSNNHNSNFKVLFGKAMNEVYNLESTIAIYPRTILSEKVFNFLKDTQIDQYGIYNGKSAFDNIKLDKDGLHYIDYIDTPEQILSIKNFEYKDYKIALEKIIKQLSSINSENIQGKCNWLQEKLVSSKILNSTDV